MKKCWMILAILVGMAAVLTGCAASEQPGTSASQGSGDSGALLGNLSTTDLEGEAVDAGLFADHTLTMINIWTTTCPYCIQEMPTLLQLHQDYADQGFQVVGLLADALDAQGEVDAGQVAEGKEIAQSAGGNYRHILPNLELYATLLANIPGVPATVFIDSEGNPVGQGLVGAKDYDTWAAIIEENLAALQ